MDAIFHTAAIVDYWSKYEFEGKNLQRINFKATQDILTAAKKVGRGCCMGETEEIWIMRDRSHAITKTREILERHSDGINDMYHGS